MYLIKYSSGSYDDWYEVAIFVTKSEDVAKAYVEKFNNLLEKWKPIVEEAQRHNIEVDFKEDEVLVLGDRTWTVGEINEAKYIQIEERI